MWILWTLIRLAVPLLMLNRPLFGALLAVAIDGLDYVFLPLHLAPDYENYQTWDKILDLYFLTFAAIVTNRWKDQLAKTISLFTYWYRCIGVCLFTFTHVRFTLIVFPNIFESLFFFYLIYQKISRREKLFTTAHSALVVTTALLTPKLIQEYFLHGIGQLPNELLMTPQLPTLFFQWFATLMIPFGVLVWTLTHSSRATKRAKQSPVQ